MKENQEQLLKDILLVVLMLFVGTAFVYCIYRATDNEQKYNKVLQKINTDSLTIDSLKVKILHDSLAHVDSLRVARIKSLNNQDNENKNQRNQAHDIVKRATNKQLDSLWSVYSPKISH